MEELDVMRQQLAVLKEKLEKETIVSDKLLREVTRQKVRRLNRNVWQEGLAVIFVLTFGNWMFYNMGCSWWFIAGTSLMMIVCMLATIIPHSWVRQKEIMSGDLLQVAKQVRRLRKLYQDWIKISIPMIIVWFAWWGWEIYKSVGNLTISISMITGGLVGGLIGGLFGGWKHKRLLREMDDIINQIEN